MAVFHWLGGHSANFADALNWNPQQEPGAGDDALIDLAGTFSVLANGAFTVNRLALASHAALSVNGSFAIAAGSAPGGIAGTVTVGNSSALDLGGVVALSGTISINGGAAATALVLTSDTLTLSGGGQVVLSDSAANSITGTSGDTLVNAGVTIRGAGTIGAGEISVINQAGGVIEASGTHKLVLSVPADIFPGQPLFQLINAGALEALAGSELDIEPGLGPTIQNVGGTIAAVGAAAVVAFGGVVSGGRLTSSGGGRIVTLGSLAALDGLAQHPITNAGTLLVTAQAPLALEGSIVNTGTISQDFDHSEIDVASPIVTLSGGGRVILAEAPVNRVLATNANFTLNNLDNRITGAGQLGLGTLTLSNAGTIDANLAAGIQDNQLVVNTGSHVVTNTGLLDATNTGGLLLLSPVMNQGGTVLASGTHAHVDLNGGTIIGGTLKTIGAATIEVIGKSTLDGLSAGKLTNAGLLRINAAQTAEMLGTIFNTGTIELQAVGAGSGQSLLALRSQTVTLSGGGKVVMDDGKAVIGGGDFNRLVNLDNTISGQGQVGNGVEMALLNSGTILSVAAAGGATGDLFLNTGDELLTNTRLLQAGQHSQLILSHVIANAGGTIAAVGAGATVFAEDSTIEGGSLQTSGGGSIFLSIGARLDGLNDGAISNTGTVNIGKGVSVDLLGSIANTGTIAVQTSAATGETDIVLRSSTVTLSGSGRLVLNNTDSVLRASGNGEQLLNTSTIVGAGTIGSADMLLSNGGRIVATRATALTLSLDSATNSATGLLQTTGTGGLVLAGGVYSNAGTIEVDVGSSATVAASAFLTNLEEGTLQGGLWREIAGAGSCSLTINTDSVRVDAATISLSGAGAQFFSGFGALGVTPLEGTLNSIAAGGVLRLLASRNFTATNTLAVAGLLQLGGGTLQAPALSVALGGQVLGFGTVQDAVPNAGRIEALGGTLAVTGAVSGAGTLVSDAGATLALGGAVNTAKAALNNGTIALGAAKDLQLTGSVNPASSGVFQLNANSLLEVLADTGASNRIAFLQNGTLAIDSAAQFGINVGSTAYAGPFIQGFTTTDKIDLKDVLLSGATFAFTAATGLLQISHSGGTNAATLRFETLGPGAFHLGNDGGGHIMLTHS